MGRPACSSCCKVVVASKEGCKNEDFSVYYTIGGGDWISSDLYAQHLLSGNKTAGFGDISKIQTPPVSRKPIETSVEYFDWKTIKEKII